MTSGEITVNGVNVKDVPQHELRDRIGYVAAKRRAAQGHDCHQPALWPAERHAGRKWKKPPPWRRQPTLSKKKSRAGFDSPISAGGNNVSGGQKQRLSIARALVKKPDIYIFDDSFSALDFKTDAALRHALKEYRCIVRS